MEIIQPKDGIVSSSCTHLNEIFQQKTNHFSILKYLKPGGFYFQNNMRVKLQTCFYAFHVSLRAHLVQYALQHYCIALYVIEMYIQTNILYYIMYIHTWYCQRVTFMCFCSVCFNLKSIQKYCNKLLPCKLQFTLCWCECKFSSAMQCNECKLNLLCNTSKYKWHVQKSGKRNLNKYI